MRGIGLMAGCSRQQVDCQSTANCQSGAWKKVGIGKIYSVSSGGGGWSQPYGPDGYYSGAYISCPNGSTLVSSGGYCDGGYDAKLYSSLPGSASCTSTDLIGSGARVTAICITN